MLIWTRERGMRQLLVLFFREEDENAAFWSTGEYLCVTGALIYGWFRRCEYLHDPQNRLYPKVAQATKLSARSKACITLRYKLIQIMG